jgi:hypothetical protein
VQNSFVVIATNYKLVVKCLLSMLAGQSQNNHLLKEIEMPSKIVLLFLSIASLFTIGWQMPQKADQSNPTHTKYTSCIELTTSNSDLCATQEADILASVIRLVLHADFQKGQLTDFRGSMGHGTVMAGRYLVTHNHFTIDLLALSPSNTQGLTGFSLYTAVGQRIIHNAHITTFRVSAQDSQTLILDFGADYFNKLNIPSASFMAADEAQLTIGTEVAQIDWDGEQAYVIWTTVTQIFKQHPSPHLQLDHYVMVGASGGGIFWQGHHVANNWAHATLTNPDSGAFTRAYTVTALNGYIIENH